ncbi:MAG TPA: FAD-dependent oxidoreductase [Pyrinomonadaceae bacterium]|jgi:thioredoxin reductase (NADPH)|nr:FAD-dependent oxidoreductase [Pyrinomonadaceae bacterium]
MHDVIIIGAGPAGLSAALWCDELGLDTLVLEQDDEIGGQLLWVYNRIANHLGGVEAENGREMRDIFAAQIEEAEFDLWTGVEIDGVDLGAKRVTLRSGEELRSISIVIATGVRRRQIGVPGEVEFAGRGVVESASRDSDFLAGKDVCVVGGGDAAVENALMLAEVCPTVTLVHRRKKLRARTEFVEKLRGTHCITVFTESVVKRIIGGERVEAVEIERRGAIKPFQMAVGGVLVRVGVEPNAEMFKDQIAFDEHGYIIVSSAHETNVENAFAVGDVSNPLAPTISGAVGAGATVAKVIAARLNGGGA